MRLRPQPPPPSLPSLPSSRRFVVVVTYPEGREELTGASLLDREEAEYEAAACRRAAAARETGLRYEVRAVTGGAL